ncbi:hypothetical protein A8990_11159 [Paenibacillus taihuensis]|uniref:Uncharacterized protein n=1 Tax=Paenibacillus taihuensis TaxID=1156355 RepID=A0A3D9S2R2_9BACL|nr:hypothetical protein A8990_11159 [Paenibacillus taihuensis]
MRFNYDGQLLTYGIGGSVAFYTKILDEIFIDKVRLTEVEIDVGMLPRHHKGLLGLDILKKYGFIIDLHQLELYTSHNN